MKKLILPIILLHFFNRISAQIGINTTSPETTLDIRSKNHLGAVTATDGVLVPRVNALSTNGSVNGQLVFLVADVGSFTAGFHYWNGSAWTPFGSGATNWYAAGTTNDAGGTKTGAISRAGSVAIGGSTPDASSILDISSTNKGVLLPRIALISSTDQTTIVSPAVGTLVYNTGTAGLVYAGYVFWNGTEWKSLNNNSTSAGTLGAISCNSVTLSPSTYTVGVSYNGTLSVPYTGSNGGIYSAQTTSSTGVTGLTATLTSGNLTSGSGALIYAVSGIPSASSPNTTTFNLNIGGQTCNATVGAGNKFTVGQSFGISLSVPGYFMNNYLDNGSGSPKSTQGGATKTRMSNNNNGNTSTYTFTQVTLGEFLTSQGKDPNNILPVVNGLRLDFKINSTGLIAPLFYNTTSSAVTISHASISTSNNQYSAVFTNVNDGAYSYQVDGDDNLSANDSSDEYDITNLTFPITGEWYQITWHSYRDKSEVDSTSKQYFYCQITRIN